MLICLSAYQMQMNKLMHSSQMLLKEYNVGSDTKLKITCKLWRQLILPLGKLCSEPVLFFAEH